MKIKVDDRTGTEAESHDLTDESILQTEKMVGIEGIGGEGGAFRQDVETGEEAQSRIKNVPVDMGVSLGAEKLQGENGEEVVMYHRQSRWLEL